jgi:DNA (cytosine-5)-methyltransferase 1
MSRLVTAGRDRLREVPILSLFTGGGFLDLGFHSTGAEIVWRNEYHKPFADAFRFALEGMGRGADSDVNTSSIVDLGPTDILREAFGRSGRPSTFGMIGGPPCPDFSVGGKNRGSSGERGQLTQVFVNRVLELRPSFFVMENVPGLTRTAKHRAFLDLQRLKLEQHYVTSLQILNALDFGTPQDRERVFFVGFNRKWLKAKKVDPIQGFHFDWPIDARFHGAKSRYEWPKVAMPGEEVRRPAEIPSELFVATHILDLALDSDIPNAREHFRPKSGKFLKIREGDDSRKSFKRLHRWRYSPTVAYGNNEVHLHPIEPRRLSVREALRLQTVPDDYALPPDMPLSHKFKMVGNGVPINLARAVATAVMSALLRVENDQDV